MKKINFLFTALALISGCLNPAFAATPTSVRPHKSAGFFVLGYAPIRREIMAIQPGTQVFVELENSEERKNGNIRGRWDRIDRYREGVWIHTGMLHNRFIRFDSIEKIWILSDQVGR